MAARSAAAARAWAVSASSARATATRLPEGVLARQGVADDERVHLVRALVGEDALEVVHVPDDRVLERDAVCAEHGSRAAAHLDRAAYVPHLPERDLLRPQRA